MDPFDTVDVTEDGEFISFKTGTSISDEDVEEYFEAGIPFTWKAENKLKEVSGDIFKELWYNSCMPVKRHDGGSSS